MDDIVAFVGVSVAFPKLLFPQVHKAVHLHVVGAAGIRIVIVQCFHVVKENVGPIALLGAGLVFFAIDFLELGESEGDWSFEGQLHLEWNTGISAI